MEEEGLSFFTPEPEGRRGVVSHPLSLDGVVQPDLARRRGDWRRRDEAGEERLGGRREARGLPLRIGLRLLLRQADASLSCEAREFSCGGGRVCEWRRGERRRDGERRAGDPVVAALLAGDRRGDGRLGDGELALAGVAGRTSCADATPPAPVSAFCLAGQVLRNTIKFW